MGDSIRVNLLIVKINYRMCTNETGQIKFLPILSITYSQLKYIQ